MKKTYLFLVFLVFGLTQPILAGGPEGEATSHDEDPVEAMLHHIGDANEFHLFGDVSIPLPCIAWSSDGLMVTMSSSFDHGHKAYQGYTLHHGILMKIKGSDFPKELVDIAAGTHGHAASHGDQTVSEHGITHTTDGGEAKEDKKEVHTITYNDGTTTKTYELEACSALQNVGSSWHDFSITKNVFAMILTLIILVFLFSKISKAYTIREKQAPKGVQSFFEPLLLFMRDEVVKPAIGAEWKKFFPFIMCLFFFILIVNLLGLVPFFPGSANVSGNVGFTIVLAFFVFIMVNINGNAHYWGHILWMPGIPTFVKPIMTIIEVIGIFMKPFTLFIRLFANITAGHIIILSLVSLIFFFAKAGGVAGGAAGIGLAVPFVFALNMLELLVAFLQAFVFSLLAALYIGAAVEEHHDHDHDHAHAH